MRCFIHPSDWLNDELLLDPEESHHLLHVLRAETGSRVELFNGRGGTAAAEVVCTQGKNAALRILERRNSPPDPVRLVLAPALLREQKMDWVIQKATELGAFAIQPLITEHAVARVKPGRDQDKISRWNKIALNSAKQCGTAWLPEIRPVLTPQDALKTLQGQGSLLVGALTPDATPVRDALRAAAANTPSQIAVFIGPEGDFSPAELRMILSAGATPVSFGRQVLRAETAALFALSVMRYELS
ncbi:MAG: RsmE family RNA methyltransferase [Lentisphaerota bacterium]